MSHQRLVQTFFLILAIVATLSAAAPAATLTYNFVGEKFPFFDPALGTLQSASVTASFASDCYFQVQNSSTISEERGDILVVLTPNLLLGNNSDQPAWAISGPDTHCTTQFDVFPNSTWSWDSDPAMLAVVSSTNDSTDLANLIPPTGSSGQSSLGIVDPYIYLQPPQVDQCSPDLGSVFILNEWPDGLFNFSGQITYTYNTVPEPSTLIIWSLLGGLGITIGWWRRRKAA